MGKRFRQFSHPNTVSASSMSTPSDSAFEFLPKAEFALN